LRPLFGLDSKILSATAVGWHYRTNGSLIANGHSHSTLGKLVHAAKQYGFSPATIDSLDIQRLASLLERALHETCSCLEWDVVTAVPSSRGTNQLPGLLAREVSEILGLSAFESHCINYVRVTREMKNLHSPTEKILNVQNAMIARKDLLDGKRVLIIDDVVETGITLSEAARACLGASAASVSIAALSKTLKYQSWHQVR
jgi:predicted amidophosphoribosyltransferase